MDPADVLDRPAELPDLVLRYAPHPDGVVDVYLPSGSAHGIRPAPLVMAVHGGFWRQRYDRRHLRPLAVALAACGFVVALPEYRRVGASGGWPVTAYDVEAALGLLPSALASAGSRLIDPVAPLRLLGHSAGGHLALWAGLRAGSSRVCGIVALAPVSDLYYAAENGVGSGAVEAFLGGGPDDVPDNYAAADVLRMLPGDVPVAVLHGTADDAVPVEMSRRLADQYGLAERHGGVPAGAPGSVGLTYHELRGVDHFALIDPLSPVFPTLVRSLDRARSSPGPPPP